MTGKKEKTTKELVAAALRKTPVSVGEMAVKVGRGQDSVRNALVSLVEDGAATCKELEVPGRGRNPLIYAKV